MSSLRQSTSIYVMRPPKPPSWRDFVASDVNNKPQTITPVAAINDNTTALTCRVLEAKSTTHLHDINDTPPRPNVITQPTSALARSSKAGRRSRAKIHRTRSEHGILSEELPSNAFSPITTKDATARSDQNPTYSKQLNSESATGCTSSTEITRRCRSWLASIEACEPLDEVSYSSTTPVISSAASATTGGKMNPSIDSSDTLHNSLHTYGEDVDVEIPDEMFVWSGDRRSSSPLSQDETFSPLIIETEGARIDRSAKVTKYSLSRSESHKNAFIPIEQQFLPDKSNDLVGFSNFQADDRPENSINQDSRKSSSKLCCDVCITFNCYRRKEVQSDT